MNSKRLSEEQMELVELLPEHLQNFSKLTLNAKVVLGQFLFLNNTDYAKNNGYFYRSNEDLMNDCEITQKKSLLRAVEKLETLGFVKKESGGWVKDGEGDTAKKANIYRLNKDKIMGVTMGVTCENLKNQNYMETIKNETVDMGVTMGVTCKENMGVTMGVTCEELSLIKSILSEMQSLKNEFVELKNLLLSMGVTYGCHFMGVKNESDTQDIDIDIENNSLAFSIDTSVTNEGVVNTKEKETRKEKSLSANDDLISVEGVNEMPKEDDVEMTYENEDGSNQAKEDFIFSERSLSANGITSSSEGDIKSSNMNTRNASGDAGEALDSSVDTCTTSAPVTQPETPEVTNQRCLEKVSTPNSLYDEIGRMQAWYDKLLSKKTWTEEDINSISKAEEGFNKRRGNVGTESQWKRIDGMLNVLKDRIKKGGGGGQWADLKPFKRRIKDRVRFAKEAPSIDMLDRYVREVDEIIDEIMDKYPNLNEKQKEYVNEAVEEFNNACEKKRAELSKYRRQQPKPEEDEFKGVETKKKLAQLMDWIKSKNLHEESDYEKVSDLVSSYAKLYVQENGKRSYVSRAFRLTAEKWGVSTRQNKLTNYILNNPLTLFESGYDIF